MSRAKKEQEKQEEKMIVEADAPQIVIIKLINNEDIICEISNRFEDGVLLLDLNATIFKCKNPLKVLTVLDPNKNDFVFLFAPWIPLTNQSEVYIYKHTIVTAVLVSETMKPLYYKQLEIIKPGEPIKVKEIELSLNNESSKDDCDCDTCTLEKQQSDAYKPKVWKN